MIDQQALIDLILKHLPPSTAQLQLLDVGGVVAAVLSEQRPDIQIYTASLALSDWVYPANSIDAVFAQDQLLNVDFLNHVLRVMRPGGRLILVHSVGEPGEDQLMRLEGAGYTRILIEPVAVGGVFIRGEKPHTTNDTLARIEGVAAQEADQVELSAFSGRYVHLLIRQSPNKPAWKLQPGEAIQWVAAAVVEAEKPLLLGFSSLPKAVSFMQPAVLQGLIQDVNKVGKFKHAVIESWQQPILGNPTLDRVAGKVIEWVVVDPSAAETPDE